MRNLKKLQEMKSRKKIVVNFAIATISDTRIAKTDKSGLLLEKKIIKSGHKVLDRVIIPDDKNKIFNYLNKKTKNSLIDSVITTGGTGLTGRDSTPEAFKMIIEKEIPGFGEIFRMISFKKISTSAIQSRAIAGIVKNKFLFALPGSPSACADAWDKILKHQFDSNFKPCNLVDLFPRLLEK